MVLRLFPSKSNTSKHFNELISSGIVYILQYFNVRDRKDFKCFISPEIVIIGV